MSVEWNQLVPTRRSLLSRLKNWEDRQSWEDFYQTYSPLIRGAACQAGLTETEAEEVAQETVLAVAKAIKGFRYEPARCAFKTWLHVITKRQVANQFRRREDRGQVVQQVGDIGGPDGTLDIPDPANEALDQIWEREWEQTLLRAATERVRRSASPAQFQIFEYHVLQDHTVMETAQALGISAARVYLAKHRVSALVRAQVEKLRKNPM